MSDALKKAAELRLRELINQIEGVPEHWNREVRKGGWIREVEARRVKIIGAQREHKYAKEQLERLQAERAELEEFLAG